MYSMVCSSTPGFQDGTFCQPWVYKMGLLVCQHYGLHVKLFFIGILKKCGCGTKQEAKIEGITNIILTFSTIEGSSFGKHRS